MPVSAALLLSSARNEAMAPFRAEHCDEHSYCQYLGIGRKAILIGNISLLGTDSKAGWKVQGEEGNVEVSNGGDDGKVHVHENDTVR